MKLVKRYLEQVETWLPDSADKDVLEELQSTIEAHIDDFEEEQGRAPDDQDIARILKSIGSPRAVAASYGKQLYLIGPELYPTWRYSVRIALTLVLILFVLSGLLRSMSGLNENFFTPGWYGNLIELGLIAFAITTLIFAVLEYQGKTDYFKDKWDPLAQSSVKQTKSDHQDAATNVISDIAFFVIWNRWLDFSDDAVYRLDSLTVQFHEVYHLLFWPVNILLLCSIALYGWQLFGHLWNKATVIGALLIDFASLVILGLMLNYVDATQVTVLSDAMDSRITENVGLIFKVSFIVIIGFTLMDLKRHISLYKQI